MFLFLLSVVGIGFALYWAFFRSEPIVVAPSVEPSSPTNTETSGTLPGLSGERPTEDSNSPDTGDGLSEASDIANGGPTTTTELSNGPVYETTLSSDGTGVNYYSKADGRFYRIDEDGNVTSLSEKQFPNVETVTWDRDSEKAVLEFPDGSNVVYDFTNEKQVTLPNHWKDFDFSPTGDEIIAKSMGLDPDNRYLVTVNSDGSNVRAFQALGENESKVQVAWSPNDQVIAFADTATSAYSANLDRKIIFPVGKNKENFKGLVIEGLGFQPSWSPSGKKLLYSASGAYSSYRPLLWVVDGTPNNMGENRKSIQLNTWAEKCTWSSSVELYCAVPNALPANAGLQPGLFEAQPDSLYRVNIETGLNTRVAQPQTDTTMTNLSVAKDGSVVYYKNAQTGELEKIKLK